jgi:CheY-like chemotaxis protein
VARDTAASPPAAIAEALTFSPHDVMFDVGLLGMDGCGAVRELRSPRTADALIVALTGYGQPSDRESALAAGFDDHLLKPTEPAQVLQVVGRGC